MKEKWDYIRLISSACPDNYGSYLIDLMQKANCNNLMEVPLDIARDYWEKLSIRLYETRR